jgi:hypothetical protein
MSKMIGFRTWLRRDAGPQTEAGGIFLCPPVAVLCLQSKTNKVTVVITSAQQKLNIFFDYLQQIL